MSSIPRSAGANWRWQLLKYAVVLVVLAAVAWQIRRRWVEAGEQAEAAVHEVRPAWLVAAGLFYLFGWLPAGIWWQQVMRATGQHPPWWASLRAYYVAHLGKYVPGKAMVLVLRAALVRRSGISAGCAVAAAIYENFFTMALGAALAGGLMLVTLQPRPAWVVLAALVFVGTGLPALPAVFNRVARRLSAILRRGEAVQIRRLGMRDALVGMVELSAGWMLSGLSLGATLHAVGGADGAALVDPGNWSLWTAAVALAIATGFAAVWFPGGLGVREGILVEVLTPSVGPGPALVATLTWRLVTVLAEAAAAGVFYLLGDRHEAAGS